MRRTTGVGRRIGLGLLCLAALAAWWGSRRAPVEPVVRPRVDLARLPLSFEPNVGQADSRVDFVSRGHGYTLSLSPTAAVLGLRHGEQRAAVTVKLAGANPHARPRPQDKLPGVSNYFLGSDPRRWHTGVAQYARAGYGRVYPGIDVVYYGNADGRLEHDFVVAPGADPRRIALEIVGADSTRLNDAGDLILAAGGGETALRAPVAYQERSGQRVPVTCRYEQRNGQVRFALGAYDRSRALVIDPVLTYSSYLGGAGTDRCNGLALDSAGNTYLVGQTDSSSFPKGSASQGTLGGGTEAFLSKVDPTGTNLVYSTYLGGGGTDVAKAVAVDASGYVYVTGQTDSADFPRASAFQGSLGGGQDGFVTKFATNGSALVYSTYLGGSNADSLNAIALDGSGAAYVCGDSLSSNYPVAAALYGTQAGYTDMVVTKLNAAGSALSYSTYLGGSSPDSARAIAVDASGAAYVAGGTASAGFPTANAAQAALNGSQDAVVLKINPAGTALTYSTFLGGALDEAATGLTVDSSGCAYVVGTTDSNDFPTSSAVQATPGGGGDGFVTKLAAAGTSWSYSTYLGGSSVDTPTSIAVDSSGHAYVAGSTASSNFPLLDPLQSTYGGAVDAFVTKISAPGTALRWSTYLGGSDSDQITGIALNTAGQVAVAGDTWSSNLPTSAPFQATSGGDYDAFTARLDYSPAATYTVTTTADAGAGSLREAISYCNSHAGADTIAFNIAGGGVCTITPYLPLPTITDTVTIDGYTQPGASPNTSAVGTNAQLRIVLDGGYTSGAAPIEIMANNCLVKGFVIRGAMLSGIIVDGSGNQVAGCFIGTDAAGTTAAGNGNGVEVLDTAVNITIGGTTAAARNLISGNYNNGVLLGSPGGGYGVAHKRQPRRPSAAPAATRSATSRSATKRSAKSRGAGMPSANTLAGNLIGVMADGSTALPNPYGVLLCSTGDTVGGSAAGAGNVIAHNVHAGVVVSGGTGNTIIANSIHENGALGIDLDDDGVTANDAGDTDTGSNNLMNFPELLWATTAGGTVTVKGGLDTEAAAYPVRLDFYANVAADSSGYGQGYTWIGTETLNAPVANYTFSASGAGYAPAGCAVSATATDAAGNTSEFSADVTAAGPASQLAFSVEPTSTTAGTALNPTVAVALYDAAGRWVPTATNTVQLAIGTNPSGSTLSGTTSVAAVGGMATFSGISLDKAGLGYKLNATGTGLNGVTSAAFNITAGPAAKLAFTAQPTNATAGAYLSPDVIVQVQDAQGNRVPGASQTVTLALGSNPGSATLAGTLSSAASGGLAYFGDLSLTKAATGYTLTASATGLTSATSSAFRVDAGTPTQLAFAVQPGTTAAGASLKPPVKVQVQDTYGNKAGAATNAITLALAANPGSAALAGTLTRSAAAGEATFDDVSLDKVASGYTLSAAATGLTGATSSTFAITAGAPTALIFTAQPGNATAGTAIAPSVKLQLRDAHGNVATGATNAVTLAIATGPSGAVLSGTTTHTPTAGEVTFTDLSLNLAGDYVLIATTAGVSGGATSSSFTISPAAPSRLVFDTQLSAAVAGTPLYPEPRVRVVDAFANTVPTATNAVTLALTTNPGGATLTGTTTRSAVAGSAAFAGLSLNRVGTGYVLSASASGLTSADSSPFNVTAGAATQLVFSVQPGNASSGAPITPAVEVVAQDACGNVATHSGSVTVGLGSNPGGATLSGTETVAFSNGRAVFPDLSLNRGGSGYTLTASGGGLNGAVSQPFDVLVTTAVAVVFDVQPANAIAGSTLAPVRVKLVDSAGELVTGATHAVTLVVTGGGATLGGTTTVAAVGGKATFSDLSLTRAGSHSLTATASGMTPATSATFQIAPAPANRLAFRVQPGAASAGAPITPAVEVELRDAYDNVTTTPASTVTVALPPGGGVLGGTTTAATVAGVARFADLHVDRPGSSYSIFATSGSLQPAFSDSFNVTVGTAARLTWVAQPADTDAGTALGALSVRIEDSLGNPVTGATTPVTVTLVSEPTVTATAVPTAGVASFSGLTPTVAHVGAQLRATCGSLPAALSAAFNVRPAGPDATRSSFTTDHTSLVANGSAAATLTVALRDRFGNPLAGVAPSEVVLSSDSAGGVTLTQPTAATSAAGVTTGQVTGSRPGHIALTATVRGVALAAHPAVTFMPRPIAAARCDVTLTPSHLAANGHTTATLHVVLRDAGGVPVEGSLATERHLAATPSSGVTVGSVGADTGADGAFDVTLTASTAGSYQLTLTVGDVALTGVTLLARPSFRLTLPVGTHFVGLPLTLDADSLAELRALPGVSLAWWDPTALAYRGTPVGSLPAFWLRCTQPLDFALRGEPLAGDPLRVPLTRGWNAMPNPFESPLCWRLSQVQVFVGGVSAGTLANQDLWGRVVQPYGWHWDCVGACYGLLFDCEQSGFEGVDTDLAAGSAVWVEALVDGVELRLPRSLLADADSTARHRARRAAATATAHDWQVELQAGAGSRVRVGQSTSLSRALVFETPPPSGTATPDVSLTLVSANGRAAGEIRPSATGAMSWELAAVTRGSAPVNLSWPSLLRSLPRGLSLELTDLQAGRTVLLNTTGGYTWQPRAAGEERRLRLTAKESRLARPDVTSMLVAPNRGHGITVALQLTADADLALEIRGLNGRLVKRVEHGRAPAGGVSLVWDGTDAQGRPVPAGTYQVEAQAVGDNGAMGRARRAVVVK